VDRRLDDREGALAILISALWRKRSGMDAIVGREEKSTVRHDDVG
jgi:hypothetical protein